jgi:hypothetical protein
LFNFCLRGTVKACPKLRQKAENPGVRVALDRIEWFDSGQMTLPSHVLSIDLAEISDEEGVFLARLADIMIDAFNPLLQSISD